MPVSQVQLSIARRIVGRGLRGVIPLLNIWTALVAARSIGHSGFSNMVDLVGCLRWGVQLRVLAWLAGVSYLGVGWQITSVCRSYEQQARIYASRVGRTGVLPAAPPGRSLHEQGRAIDIVFDPDNIPLVAFLARVAGIRWGGERDPVHWEA